MHKLLASLNPAQQEAAHHTRGPLLIIAGAGSGKTRVITTRIALLLHEHRIPASQIVALTFTNKAAREMKERIMALLGPEQPLPFLGTFHGYCVRMLKQYAAFRTTPFGGILDGDDQQKIIKSILTKYGLQKQLNAASVAHQISHIKNRSHDRERFLREHTNKLFAQVYQAYEQEKKLMHCLDFDDLLTETVALFENPTCSASIQEQVRHVLIDEYQDTNSIQHELLKKLCLTATKQLAVDSICAVGDEDQSIYSWRGATVTNIRNFTHDFPTATLIKIEQNYRSAQQILDVANTVISHNAQRIPKKLWSDKKGKDRVMMLTFGSQYQEADALALIATLATTDANTLSCAFLYRMHAQSRTLEEALVQKSIPYRIVGGTQFYERMEVRDVLAYLKVAVNPFDRISAARLLNTPNRGLGAKAEEEFFARWDAYPTEPFLEIIQMSIAENTGLKAQTYNSLKELFTTLTTLTLPTEALKYILLKTQYIRYLQESYEKEEAAERIANVEELLNAATQGEKQGTHTVPTFLESVALMQEQLTPHEDTQQCVLLMTLHAAKGLEFDTVVVCGLEEGVIPTSRALYDQEALEEERRLLYVGITRARERLLFTQARTRLTYGKVTDQLPSRFIKELPTTHVAHHDATLWRTPMLKTCISQWLNISHITSSVVTAVQQKQDEQQIKQPVSQQATFRVHQPVKHTQFGIGVIKQIEERNTQTIITAQFRSGVKKIVSDFLIPL